MGYIENNNGFDHYHDLLFMDSSAFTSGTYMSINYSTSNAYLIFDDDTNEIDFESDLKNKILNIESMYKDIIHKLDEIKDDIIRQTITDLMLDVDGDCIILDKFIKVKNKMITQYILSNKSIGLDHELLRLLCNIINITEFNFNMMEENTMTKLVTIQKRENLNDVFQLDEKGPGGAYHKYGIMLSEDSIMDVQEPKTLLTIKFQKGPRKDPNSEHGVLDSDLLEIVRNRLKCFQEGEFASEYNAKALEHVELALMYLNRRVEDRIERNVLGTNEK